jgi:protein-L-isoaspartate(D-aspartate) O-methyltransferase
MEDLITSMGEGAGTKMNHSEYGSLREAMVRVQLIPRGIHDQRVLNAMKTVPRHLFVPESLRDQAYRDSPLPIGEGQTISQPYIVAAMTQALDLHPEDRILEIGTGTAYQTAILAELAGQVFSIESLCTLLERARRILDGQGYTNIITQCGDGTLGWPEHSPYNAIMVTAGAPQVPSALVRQLAVGGRLLIPVGDALSQNLLKITNTADGLTEETLGGCRFVKLVGAQGWQE